MGIPSPVSVPPGPSWVIVNLDNPVSLPVVGQFDPKIRETRGEPIWATRPGILGSQPWLRYVGRGIGTLKFEFLGIATTILDPFPFAAWTRLQELSHRDETLGRPPRVLFTHGAVVREGFITGLPEAPYEYWGGDNALRSRLIRQIGPVDITITILPKEPTELSFFTSYIQRTEDTLFEEVALSQYGDARYALSLDLYNQGVKNGETIEVPRKRSGSVTPRATVAPFLGDDIEGL